jgi:LPS export ABC transporter protein LptC
VQREEKLKKAPQKKPLFFFLTPLFCLFFTSACSFDYEIPPSDDENPNLVLRDAEYVRIGNGNPEILVRAEEVRRYEKKHTMELDTFSFEQFNAASEGYEKNPDMNASGSAALARLETDTGNFSMEGGVSIEVVSEDISMDTPKIIWIDKERLLTAPEELYIVRSDGTTLRGSGFSADLRKRSWEFESAVEGAIVDDEDGSEDNEEGPE